AVAGTPSGRWSLLPNLMNVADGFSLPPGDSPVHEPTDIPARPSFLPARPAGRPVGEISNPVLSRAEGERADQNLSNREITEDLAEAWAEQLLFRYGVVFRDVVQQESFSVPWREILRVLRRMEAQGAIRGGRFVAGV